MTKGYAEMDGSRCFLSLDGHATYEGPRQEPSAAGLGGKGAAMKRASPAVFGGARDVQSAGTQVCAAISALAYAMAGYLTNAELEGRAEVYTMKMEGGSVVIHASGDERCVGACEAVLLGLRQIAEQYPDYLSMDFLEE